MKPQDLDALLGRWPALEPQQKGGASWDERADAIVAAAVARKSQGASDATEALLAPPPLEAEPGEEKAQSFHFTEATKSVDGGAAGRASSPSAPNPASAGATAPMANDQGKKPSLKELAARASQAGAARGSIPPASRASTPPPGRISSIPSLGLRDAQARPVPQTPVPATGATVTPIARAKPSGSPRASDPGREDSGILRLADIQAEEAAKAEAAAVAAETALAAAKDKPAVKAPVVVAPAVAANTGNKAGMWAGVAIAVMGVAAAFAVYRTRQPDVAPPKTDVVAVAPTSKPGALAAQTASVQAPDQPAVVASSEPAPAATDAPKTEPSQGATGTAAASATAVAEVKPSTSSSAAPKGSKVGTLDEEMKKAVGSSESQPAPADDSKPAAGGGGALPDQPSQGNAQAAVRAVLPGARACVAGAPETSSASVTFSSSGSVQSVSVGGWAAQNGKTGCVKSALQGAHVAPFAKSTFTVPVTIRP